MRVTWSTCEVRSRSTRRTEQEVYKLSNDGLLLDQLLQAARAVAEGFGVDAHAVEHAEEQVGERRAVLVASHFLE